LSYLSLCALASTSFFVQCALRNRHLHSFPTRRSSDLAKTISYSCQSKLLLSCPVDGSRRGRRTRRRPPAGQAGSAPSGNHRGDRSEEHTSELQSRENLVCRLLLEKKKKKKKRKTTHTI